MSFDEPHRLVKEVLLPDWARQDKQGTKGDRVDFARDFVQLFHNCSKL
jgi:hypothetical protein